MAAKPNMTLDEWQKAVLPWLRTRDFAPSNLNAATLLAYFFWDDDRIETKFYTIECAFLCAFQSWGIGMPATLVTNRQTESMRAFCEKYGVRLDIDPTLTGGVPRMNIDCIRNLHSKFDTDYVVVLQSDGMPVRPGLENFFGKWDYIGAPWPGYGNWKDWFIYPRFGVGNGGFCLRSKRICRQAAKSYEAFWKHLPYTLLVGDDVFYCKTMPFLSRRWRKAFRYPTIEEALKFSIEYVPRGVTAIEVPPLGFHSEAGFRNYSERFGIPFADEAGL